MLHTLKGGQTTKDKRLDRVIQFDERSRQYPIRALVGAQPWRSKKWRCPVVLDQGQEGACVGFAWTAEKAATPVSVQGMTGALALETYRRAQLLDEWPGEAYSGTSVIAGVQAGQEQGFYGEYRWGFSLEDLILGLWKGPAVLGIPWYDGMYETDGEWLRVRGGVVGGHAILCRGVDVPGRYFILHNSWGPGWGTNGDARISFDDLERLLHEDGEACIPVQRRKGKL